MHLKAMYKELQFQITGIAPLLMHDRDKLANKLHPLYKQLNKFSGKRAKSEEDLMAISKLEWIAGMYLTKEPQIAIKGTEIKIVDGGVPCIPVKVSQTVLVSGAKKFKLGTAFKPAVLVEEDALLQYSGPKDLEKLWEDGNYIDMRPVTVQRNCVMRSRAIFREWGFTLKVNYDPRQVNPDQIRQALEAAGTMCGVGDYRPQHGRFKCLLMNGVQEVAA